MRRKLISRLTTAVAVATAVAACGTGAASTSGDAPSHASIRPLAEVTPVPDPRAYEGPSTAKLADRAVEPVVESPEQTLPATVVSHDRSGDRKVVVEDTDRVLALDISGSLSATVWALGLGDRLVGRDVSTTFPGTKKLPVVTSDGHSLNAESILKVRPSLVITDGSIGPRDVVEQLRDAGVTVVFVDNDPSYSGAVKLTHEVAATLGVPAAGDKLADRIEQQLDDVRGQIERLVPADRDDRVTMAFLYLRGSAGVYYLLGEDSGVGDLIEGLGGVDLAKKLRWTSMRPLTDEAVVSADPDLFLVMTDGLKSVGGIDKLLAEKPALALTKAGKHRRFVDMADGDILSFGPRSAGVLEALARAVYAPDAQ